MVLGQPGPGLLCLLSAAVKPMTDVTLVVVEDKCHLE